MTSSTISLTGGLGQLAWSPFLQHLPTSRRAPCTCGSSSPCSSPRIWHEGWIYVWLTDWLTDWLSVWGIEVSCFLQRGTESISMWTWVMELRVGSLRAIRQFRDDEERVNCCRWWCPSFLDNNNSSSTKWWSPARSRWPVDLDSLLGVLSFSTYLLLDGLHLLVEYLPDRTVHCTTICCATTGKIVPHHSNLITTCEIDR